MEYITSQLIATCSLLLGWECIRGVCKLAEVPIEWDSTSREYLLLVGLSIILAVLIFLDFNVWWFETTFLAILGICCAYYWLHKNPLEPIIVPAMVLATRIFIGITYAVNSLMNLNKA